MNLISISGFSHILLSLNSHFFHLLFHIVFQIKVLPYTVSPQLPELYSLNTSSHRKSLIYGKETDFVPVSEGQAFITTE